MKYIEVKIIKDEEGVEYALPIKYLKEFRGDWDYFKKHKELSKFYEKYNQYKKEDLKLYIINE
jgi:hypothetical protein